jgi:uracil-DNA glycosylase family 4
MDMEERFEALLKDAISFIDTESSSAYRYVRTETTPGKRTGHTYDPAIDEEIRRCKKCRLHESRKNAVPGTGDPAADILFVGEGPGEQEDMQGLPFVGKAGQLLTKMLSAIDLSRKQVFITNIVKCRPPGNRNPLPDEVESCFPYLERQIGMIQPLVIVCLGGPAAQAILKSTLSITQLRERMQRYADIPVIATYHPAAVLRFPEKYKRAVWNDLKLLRDLYRDLHG